VDEKVQHKKGLEYRQYWRDEKRVTKSALSHKINVTLPCPHTGAAVTIVTSAIINCLTLTLLMSYIYMEHPFLKFLDHTQRRTTVGRTPLDE